MEIITIDNKKESKILRKKTVDFNFAEFKKAKLKKNIQLMRTTMEKAQGIGLSANQVGIDLNFFVAEIDSKFYAIFNSKIEKSSEKTEIMEEGCLSVPNAFGKVERPGRVVLSGFDQNGKKIRIKAWGLLARVFQHEVDHLNGILFIDKSKNVRSVKKTDTRNPKS